MKSVFRRPLLRWSAGASLVVCLSLAAVAQAQTVAPVAPPAHALPGGSIYQIAAPLTDHNGRVFTLKEHLGRPVLVSMFYSTCQFVCPMLIDTMALTQKALTPHERAQLDLLLITFDPERDDVRKLKSIAVSREVDSHEWTLARTDSSSTRKLAATLGIQYRLLSDGDFNHTTVLVLLDAEGRPVARTKKMGVLDPDFVKQVKQVLFASSNNGT